MSETIIIKKIGNVERKALASWNAETRKRGDGFENAVVEGIELERPSEESDTLSKKFKSLMDEAGISYESGIELEGRVYDFKVGDTLIEVDDYITHNSTWAIKDMQPKAPRYHVESSEIAKNNGYHCLHIFNWDNLEKIIKMLLPKERIYARKCTVMEISQQEANKLLNGNHLQGRAKMQTVCLGLFYDNKLVEVMTFGKPRFNKKFEWELIRLCTLSGYLIIGGTERLFNHFIENYDPTSIISYCDASKFKGNVYTNLGFDAKVEGASSKHWYNPKDNMHVTDNGLRMRGFDLLLGDKYGTYGKGTDNNTLMRSVGFVEIFDAGQSVYTWNKKQ